MVRVEITHNLHKWSRDAFAETQGRKGYVLTTEKRFVAGINEWVCLVLLDEPVLVNGSINYNHLEVPIWFLKPVA